MNTSTPLLAETTPHLLLFWLAEASRRGPTEGNFHSGGRNSVDFWGTQQQAALQSDELLVAGGV